MVRKLLIGTLAGCALAIAVLAMGCGSVTKAASTNKSLTSSSTCQEWTQASVAKRQQFAMSEESAIQIPATYSHGSEAAAYAFGYLGGHCYRAEQAGHAATTTLAAVLGLAPSTGETTSHDPTTTSPPASKTTLAFSRTGQTEHGDKIHVEGRWGPILPPEESDVDQKALQSCPETDGRELVRRLDLTFAITSGLSGEVRMTPPIVSVNEEEGAEEIRNLNFIVDGPEGISCHKGLGEETGFAIDLGVMQPKERRTLSVWAVMIDAITPTDPHPSRAKLKAQEWLITYPAVSVDGAIAISGGEIWVTE